MFSMFCSHCGAKMEKGFQYCPVCGSKAATTPKTENKSHSDNQNTPQAAPKKPMPLWFKLLAFMAVLALIGVTAGILFTESLVDVIDHQLEALRKEDINKAYSYTSKDFQSSTSLSQFKDFVLSYPVFTNNQSAHFTKRSLKDNIGTLKGNLTSNDRVNVPIEYKLIKEGDKWKILSIRLLKPNLIPHAKGAGSTQALTDVATELLTLIRDGKFDEAYQKYASNEFKKATPQEDFLEFIKGYPLLEKFETITFPKAVVRNGVGSLGAIVKEKESEAYVKFYLIHEDQNWKILSMRILSPAEESIEEPIAFGDLTLGTEIDEQGVISNPEVAFKSDLKDLFINLDVENGLQGEEVNLTLYHLESGSTIPVKVKIAENGDTMLVSTISPPQAGWLKGEYRLVATTSSGLSKSVEFTFK
jgi:uncharacterized Zn finger protein (UPF0148 family)